MASNLSGRPKAACNTSFRFAPSATECPAPATAAHRVRRHSEDAVIDSIAPITPSTPAIRRHAEGNSATASRSFHGSVVTVARRRVLSLFRAKPQQAPEDRGANAPPRTPSQMAIAATTGTRRVAVFVQAQILPSSTTPTTSTRVPSCILTNRPTAPLTEPNILRANSMFTTATEAEPLSSRQRKLLPASKLVPAASK